MFLTLIASIFLRTTSLQLGDIKILVEVADTPETRARGLMERTHLGENRGMLFVYEKPETVSFWMKNTKIPLSIGFFNENQELIQIEEMEPPRSKTEPLATYVSEKPVQYALEMSKNWFEKNKIAPGMKFTFLDHPRWLKSSPLEK